MINENINKEEGMTLGCRPPVKNKQFSCTELHKLNIF